MSDDRRRTIRTVRVRRSPKITVFLALGSVVGAFVALIATMSVPPDPRYPVPQVLGFLILLLAPIGALAGGLIAIVIDAAMSRSARMVEAEHDVPVAADVAPEPVPEAPAAVAAAEPDPDTAVEPEEL